MSERKEKQKVSKLVQKGKKKVYSAKSVIFVFDRNCVVCRGKRRKLRPSAASSIEEGISSLKRRILLL